MTLEQGDFLVTSDDTTGVVCAWGVRRWLHDQQLDRKQFFRCGLPASVLLATGDAMAQSVVEHARQRRQVQREVSK